MNYRNIVFNYIGDVVGVTISTQTNTKTTSRQELNISGRKGKFMYLFWIVFSFFAILFSQISENTNPIINNFDNIYINLILFGITILIVLLRRYLLYKRLEPKPVNINLYSRDLPSKLRPAHMRLLMGDGTIDGISIGSTLMDLVDRGYLEYIKGRDVDDKLIFFHDSNTKLIKTNKEQNDLLKYEKFLIDWFISGYGNGVEVSASEVNEGLKKKLLNGDMEAADMFLEWQALVLMSFQIDKYYRKIEQSKSKLLFNAVIGFGGFFLISTTIGAIAVIYGLGMFFLVSPKRILKQERIDEIHGWLTLKRFLKDFGDMQNKTAEMIKIWDFYLTYSIALDMSEVASNDMTTFFGKNIYIGSIDPSIKKVYHINSNKSFSENINDYKK